MTRRRRRFVTTGRVGRFARLAGVGDEGGSSTSASAASSNVVDHGDYIERAWEPECASVGWWRMGGSCRVSVSSVQEKNADADMSDGSRPCAPTLQQAHTAAPKPARSIVAFIGPTTLWNLPPKLKRNLPPSSPTSRRIGPIGVVTRKPAAGIVQLVVVMVPGTLSVPRAPGVAGIDEEYALYSFSDRITVFDRTQIHLIAAEFVVSATRGGCRRAQRTSRCTACRHQQYRP